MLTTGAKSGVKVENKFGSPEHADRLMHSEFGLACLWDRRGELVTIWKLVCVCIRMGIQLDADDVNVQEHPTIRYHGNKHVIVIPLKKDGKGDLKVTVLKLDFKKDLDKLKLSIEHQLCKYLLA